MILQDLWRALHKCAIVGLMQGNVTVISLGGSIIAPRGIDTGFLKEFSLLLDRYLMDDVARRLVIVCGGGSLARDYQSALRAIVADSSDEDLDWVGIAATRVNGELVRRMLAQRCVEELVSDPTAVTGFAGRVLVAAGWKPGFSTDNDAILLAKRLSASTVINLSNLAQVYREDPKKNPAAQPLENISWTEMRRIVGDSWTPGKNTPFDPIAAREAAAAHIRVIFAFGRDLANLGRILAGLSFVGTTIGPE